MAKGSKRLAIVWLVCAALCTPAWTQQAAPEGAAERRAREFAQLVGSTSRAAFQKYVQENFGPPFRDLPFERHADFFFSLQDTSRGLEFHSIQATQPNVAALLFKTKLTGQWLTLGVRVEPEPPHRIINLTLPLPRPPASAKPAAMTREQVAQELAAIVKKLADADVFSGTVLLAKDGVAVYKGAFGHANKDFAVPNRVDTKFNLGSMNKMFTGVAIAQLAERGKLSFEDPLSKFVPDFPDKASAEKIKIKHLLTHTAGLGGYFSEKWFESSRTLYRTVDDMMRRVKEDEKQLLFEPGSRWQYSNTGMLVLGKVIEVASGQSYFDYIRDHITQPAGMANTGCYELDKVNPNLAVGYDKQFGDSGFTYVNNVFLHVLRGGPQGGCYSTAEDLLRFDVALRGNKLVGAEYVKQLLAPRPDLNSPTYGYGFQLNPQAQIAGHGGGFPGISSNLDMFLSSGWTAIVMSNYGQGARPVQQAMREFVAAAAPAAASR